MEGSAEEEKVEEVEDDDDDDEEEEEEEEEESKIGRGVKEGDKLVNETFKLSMILS